MGANATSKTRNTIYNEEGKLSQPESISSKDAQAIVSLPTDGSASKAPPRGENDGVPPSSLPKDEALWKVSESVVDPGKDGFHYLHKKFKKMEAPSSSEDDPALPLENGDREQAIAARDDGDDEDPAAASSKPANLSLEALFQVTGHELQKIKCSEEDVTSGSPGSDQKRKSPSPSEADEGREGATTGSLENGLEERELSKRLRLGGGRHVCPYCGLACGKPSVLQKHVRAHTNERPYPCVPCGFAFKTKSNLYKHCKSRAHHLKVATGEEGGATAARLSPSDAEPEDADVIETDDSTNSEDQVGDEEGAIIADRNQSEEGALTIGSLSLPLTGGSERTHMSSPLDEMVITTASSAIYKPKFHSVAYLAPMQRPLASSKCSSPHSPLDVEASLVADRATPPDVVTKRFVHPTPLGRNNGAVQKDATGSSVATVGLAKRRNEQFQLRLEIPGPRPVSTDAFLPTLTSSSSSSSSGAASAATPISTLPNRLPIPASAGTSTPLPSQKSPKLASPEYLQQHISNLISQNAAIVETLDPLWPRRYTRQCSVASSHNVDAELRSKERLRRFSEDVTISPVPGKSKLALALLAATVKPAAPLPSTTAEATPNSVSAVDATYRPAANVTYRVGTKDIGDGAMVPVQETDSGSIVKTLLMAPGLGKSSPVRLPDAPHHPQNPEGSIIKDLLLKTRPAVAAPTATCMRLSGGSISTSVAAEAPLEPAVTVADGGATVSGPYTCAVCNISYRKAENLEIHCAHYCQKGARPQVTPSTCSTFVLLPPPPPPTAATSQSSTCEVPPPATVTVILPASLEAATAAAIPIQPVPAGCIPAPKPRGRPRGSKNRPKYEAPPAASGTSNRVAVRVHSKSVSESALEPDMGVTSGAPKQRPNFRRNSISGELSDSVKDILMSRSLFARVDDGGSSSLTEVAPSSSASSDGESSWSCKSNDGPILKKHLLAGGVTGLDGDKSPPLKKRKIPEDVLQVDAVLKKDGGGAAVPPVATVLSLKSLEQLSRYPMRPSAVHLFGGEVQICDGAETKKIIIDHKMQPSPVLPPSGATGLTGLPGPETTSSVVATIAKPVHNSGGTVLQVQEAKTAPSVCIPVVAIARPLMATGTMATASSGALLLSPGPVAPAVAPTFTIDISQLKLGQPLPPKPAPAAITVLPPVVLRQVGTTPKTPVSINGTGLEGIPLFSAGSLTDSVADVIKPPKRLEVPVISIQSPKPQDVPKTSGATTSATTTTTSTTTEATLAPSTTTTATATPVTKTLLSLPRPTSLLLKNVHTSMAGMTMVSPETPRPKKKYGQCYLNGQYYTYLELKQSTRVYYCNCRPQPMFVPQSVDPKLSMYSMWQTVPAEPDPFGLTPPQAMSLYASKPRYQAYAIAGPSKMPLVVTHSSYWTFQQKEKKGTDGSTKKSTATRRRQEEEDGCDEQETDKKQADKDLVDGIDDKPSDSEEGLILPDNEEEVDVERTTPSPVREPKQPKVDIPLKHRLKDTGNAVEPKRVKIFEGGFKSNEDYTYVRGRGRGKYVCEECGIRCKKPSMLKKHIRTHTDVRPYTCKHCNFSFKTKGNLTKHMKSKAHHKKCVVLGIVPVPVTIDDAQIDEEALARQERIEHQRKQFADDEDSLLEDDDDDEDDEDEEEEEDDEDEAHEEYKEGEDEDDESLELDGQFEDASETPAENLEVPCGTSPKPHSEQEIAKSLLELGKSESVMATSVSPVEVQLPSLVTREAVEKSISLDCVVGPSDEREELIGNPRVAWSASSRNLSEVGPASRTNDNLLCADGRVADIEATDYPLRGVQCLESVDDVETGAFVSRPQPRSVKDSVHATALFLGRAPPIAGGSATLAVEDVDQPMDLSMPHSRPEDDLGDYDDTEEDRAKLTDESTTGDLQMLNPYYEASPQFSADGRLNPEVEHHRSSPRCYENISPASSAELHRHIPIPVRSPYRPAAVEPIRNNLGDWSTKTATTSPPPSRPSVLHSYLSEQPPAKRVAVATASRGGSSRRHRTTSSSTFGGGRKSPSNRSGMLTPPTPPAPYPPPALFYTSATSPPPRSAPARPESPQEILSPASLSDCSPSRLPPVGISSLAMYIHRSMDDGKCICTICNKAFSKPSHLRLHVNIHYFERPFRCDSCAISFRTKGHLQKHKRSVSHYNKVNMNMTFGTPTTDNPRPFKCEDCKIAFRIHGHLAKHLRSKMHIMKLECLGKLPFGTYAEIERSGANLNEIDTTDCENSLESLQVMAHRLVEKDPTVQHWPRERTISGGSCDDQSDGIPYVESPVGSSTTAPAAGHYRSQSVGEDGCVSPDFADAGRLVMWSQRPFESNLPPSPDSGGAVPLPGIKMEPAEGSGDLPHLVDPRPGTIAATAAAAARQQDIASRLELGQRTSSSGSLVQDYEDISDDDDELEVESLRRGSGSGTVCRICGEVVKSAKFLQLHMYINHVDGGSSGGPKASEEFPPATAVGVARKLSSPPLPPPAANSPSWRVPVYPTLPSSIAAAVIEEQDYICELCGEVYPNGHTLKQHMMMHARLRPYICEFCDAGFTTSHYLKLHLQTHQQRKAFACQECHQSFSLIEELERHVDHVHPSLDGEQVR